MNVMIGCLCPRRALRRWRGRALLVVVFVLMGAVAACELAGPDESSSEYRRIGYVLGSRGITVSPADAQKLTHINYAFANVRNNRVVLEHPQTPDHLDALNALKDSNPHLEILLSVGGWAWSDHFSDAALTEASRDQFARSAAALVKEHNLDGLDLDWEYPGQRGQDNTFRAEDKQNFTLLLKAVRARLDSLQTVQPEADPYLLTIAAGADSTYLAHTEMAEAHKPLDFVNLMTYDFHGSWTDHTGHHANVHEPAVADTAEPSAAASVERFVEAGVPPEKLVIGAAFYGRGWSGVAPNRRGRYQPYDTARGALSYDSLSAAYINQNGFARYWDEAAQAPYLWNAETATFITYDDPASLRAKADFVRARDLGGIMYWEHGHDPSGTLLDALYENL